MSIINILIKYEIEFKESGKELITLCPFHQDSSPSCYIHAENGLFYCFSCHASGGIQRFLEKRLNKKIDKREIFSLEEEILGKINALYQDSYKKLHENEDYSEFLQILENEKQNFIDFYESKDALAFLLRKNTDIEICKRYGLKYGVHGRYSGRIIFPLFNKGKEIGFHSRDITGLSSIKYMFNVYTEYFKDFIFNIENVYSNNVILVEGIFDVFGLIQRGFPNVVSTLSTTVKDEHILALGKFKNIIFCFDPDYAGEEAVKKAALRILDIFPTKSVYFVELPMGKDPDEVSLEECQHMFKKLRQIKKKTQEFTLELSF